jgi:hypothetical protein
MDTWVWILIAVGAVVVLGVLLVGGRRARERRLESKRSEAAELRADASTRAARAEEREALAEEQAERARRERVEADEVARRADEIDPDRET